MIHNLYEYISTEGDLCRLCYDIKCGVYYLQNITQSGKYNHLDLRIIESNREADRILKYEKRTLIYTAYDVDIFYNIHEKAGMAEDGLSYNLFTNNKFLDCFLDDSTEEVNSNVELVSFLENLFDTVTEKEIFFKTLARYIETGQKHTVPFKVIDYQNRFMYLNLILHNLLGHSSLVTVDKELSISVIHISRIKQQDIKDLATQTLFQKITERTKGAGLHFALYKQAVPSDGFPTVKFSTTAVPEQLALSTEADIMEAVKWLKRFKGEAEYPKFVEVEEVVSAGVETINLLKQENWKAIEELCKQYELKDYDIFWERGAILRPMLLSILEKQAGEMTAKKLLVQYKKYIEAKGKTCSRLRTTSHWSTKAASAAFAFSPFKSLKEYNETRPEVKEAKTYHPQIHGVFDRNG